MKILTFLLAVFSVFLSADELRAHFLIGYMPSWQGSADDIAYDKLTHIHYAFLLPSASGDGSLEPLENKEKLQRIVQLAHAHGVKVQIAVGGWTDLKNPGFEKLSRALATRTRFADNLLAFVESYGLDGVDIDWEYPNGAEQSEHYLLMMQTLAEKLHAAGKTLSAAVADDAENGGFIDERVFQYADFIEIMAYDGDTEEGHAPLSLAESALDYWLGRKLPPAKAVLGVPFYARPSWKTYKALLARGADPHDDFFNDDSYNGMDTVAEKTRLAVRRANGIMIWELSGDAQGEHSLLSVVAGILNEKPKAAGSGAASP